VFLGDISYSLVHTLLLWDVSLTDRPTDRQTNIYQGLQFTLKAMDVTVKTKHINLTQNIVLIIRLIITRLLE